MPLMREWTEITVDEDLLIPVVQELLAMAMDPNHVEVVYGVTGRVILAEVHLAEHWYLERLKREEEENAAKDVEVHAGGFEVVASAKVEPSTEKTQVPLPAKRGSAPKPSASPDGEET